jgi:hypothetical protein
VFLQFIVSGNLLHHAIEMVLKALLVGDLQLAGVKEIGHNLEALWTEATAKHPALALERRLRTVRELHGFESLRYPDKLVTQGAAININITRPPPSPPFTVPSYQLVLEDVDELFQAIIVAWGKNPHFAMLGPKALEVIRDRNKTPFI